MTPPEIFDRNARRTHRDRAINADSFFAATMAGDLLDRLDSVKRRFDAALVIGADPTILAGLRTRGIACVVTDTGPHRAANAGGTTAEEDRLAFQGHGFDLILSSGCLDTVSDLPGALILARRMLVPDGFFLANFAGAPCLPALRRAVEIADRISDRAVSRFHPLIDVRAAGDLLVRAGFALPVADLDTHDIAYRDVARLVQDLRDAAATNVLSHRYPVTRSWVRRVEEAFAAGGKDARTHETLSVITLTGWAPAPSQPQPAPRGSGRTSLSDALKRKP